MKKAIITTGGILTVALGMAGQPRMTFDKEVCDMGEILWKQPVTVTFTLTNTGSEPLQITNVDPSCGCVEPTWPKEPVAPGGKAAVSATYDAKQLGHFEKSLGIYTEGSDAPRYVTLKGVVRTELKDYSRDYPIQVGSLYMDRNQIEFPDVNRGDKPTAEIRLLNGSDKEYEPILMHLPTYLEAKAVPETLPPGRAGILKLTLRSEALRDLGMTHTSVYLSRFPGDKVGEENEISVMAVLLPDFSQLTETERAMAPVAGLSATELTFSLNGKKKASQTVIMTNTGKSALEIRSIQVTAPSVNVSIKKRSLQPGESMKIKVTAVAEYVKKRRHTPRVLIVTNDPARPKVEIRIQTEL